MLTPDIDALLYGNEPDTGSNHGVDNMDNFLDAPAKSAQFRDEKNITGFQAGEQFRDATLCHVLAATNRYINNVIDKEPVCVGVFEDAGALVLAVLLIG